MTKREFYQELVLRTLVERMSRNGFSSRGVEDTVQNALGAVTVIETSIPGFFDGEIDD